MATVHLATCARLPEPDPDEPLLVRALERAGVRARVVAWDDPSAPAPGEADAVVLRSTWNYYRNLGAFLEWCERAAAASTLLNPLGAVRRNVHKRYLLDLESAGVPIVPTALFDRGACADLGRVMRERGWSDVVIKPAVSAGSFATRRFRLEGAGGSDAAAFLEEQLVLRDMMAQPYLRSVEGSGERSIIWLGGEVAHSIRKSPRFAGEDESVSEAIEPSADERAFALRTLDAAGETGLLYARVDVMRGDGGGLLLSELELVEPSLFFLQAPRSLELFVARLLERMAR